MTTTRLSDAEATATLITPGSKSSRVCSARCSNASGECSTACPARHPSARGLQQLPKRRRDIDVVYLCCVLLDHGAELACRLACGDPLVLTAAYNVVLHRILSPASGGVRRLSLSAPGSPGSKRGGARPAAVPATSPPTRVGSWRGGSGERARRLCSRTHARCMRLQGFQIAPAFAFLERVGIALFKRRVALHADVIAEIVLGGGA